MDLSRKPIFAANWKLNKTIREAIEFVTLFKRNTFDVQNVDIVICPTYTALSEVSELLVESGIYSGAQDMFWEEKGAFTGEVSASLIKDAGARYVIIGHSERRQFFHETHETVNKKTKAALGAGLIPIVCVGESLKEREAGATFRVIEEQLAGAFDKFDAGQMKKIVLAYEPVWAIGTGKTATPEMAADAHRIIRAEVAKLLGAEVAAAMRILYGGSVKPDNATALMGQEEIDGALVGGASLKPDSFEKIVMY